MRTLKFRGKDKETGEWIYSTGFLQHSTGIITMIVGEQPDGFITSPIVPETIGQLVCNRNGIDFYEGDIAQYKQVVENYDELERGPRTHNVPRFTDKKIKFEIRSNNISTLANLIDEQCTVIGNIHDNPELYVTT